MWVILFILGTLVLGGAIGGLWGFVGVGLIWGAVACAEW